MTQATLPLLHLRPADIASRVLVVGDPARAGKAALLLDEFEKVGENREYVTYTGHYEGRRVSIVSHGIGSAGAGLAFEELARGGARVMIRAGTCGAVNPALADGDAVIATGAVRDEGLTPRLLPSTYPALADHRVILALESAAAAQGVATRSGVVLTSDLFYPSAALGQDWSVWQASHVQVVEMEAAALFIVATLHGIVAGGIFAVDGNPTLAAQDMSEYDPHRSEVQAGVETILRIALKALVHTEVEP
ncbi:MAG: nucleoside phosphorylase [Acidobacteriota bacterium]